MEIQGYELVQSDHPLQHKRGGVCIYLKNSFPLEILNIHCLHESISYELQGGSKICKLISLYQSPRHTSSGFEKFTDNLELTLDTLPKSNSHLIVAFTSHVSKNSSFYIAFIFISILDLAVDSSIHFYIKTKLDGGFVHLYT